MRLTFVFAACVACGTGSSPSGGVPQVQVSCSRTQTPIPTGVVGLSDPNTIEPVVIDLVEESGAPWVRAELHWSIIQPEPDGPYDFSAYDAMIDAYSERGIQVQAILTYIPPAYERDWQAIDDGFRAFSIAAVQRYAPKGVHHWEIFNEPNLPGYGWLTDSDDAASNLPNYVRLLGIGNEVVREHDPDGVVLIGGIASEQHRGMALEPTLDVIYDNDAGDCFDVLAFHPYGYQNQFDQAGARVQAALDAHDDGAVPVWFNEYGWTDQASMDLAVNPTAETNPMLAAFDQRDAADALFWFSAKDYSSRASAPTFGLAEFDGTKRPSFDTFQAVMEAVDR